jgi:hypothetical protein
MELSRGERDEARRHASIAARLGSKDARKLLEELEEGSPEP